MGKLEKGVEIGIGKDIVGVPLVEVRIKERLLSEKIMLRIYSFKMIPCWLGCSNSQWEAGRNYDRAYISGGRDILLKITFNLPRINIFKW